MLSVKKNPRIFPSRLKKKLYELNKQCSLCGDPIIFFRDARADHIIPWSYGGPTEEWNLQVLCKYCNLEKGNKIIMEPEEIVKKLESNTIAWRNSLCLIANYYKDNPKILGKICFDLFKGAEVLGNLLDGCAWCYTWAEDGEKYSTCEEWEGSEEYKNKVVRMEGYMVMPYEFVIYWMNPDCNHFFIDIEGFTLEHESNGVWNNIKRNKQIQKDNHDTIRT
jgi:hypothetical protein